MNMAFPGNVENKGTVAENIQTLTPPLLPDYFQIFMQRVQPVPGVPGFPTFRILKTDLDLRPVYHQNDESTMAHLHLGLLAYWLVNTVRYQLKNEGINSSWREIIRTMNTQKAVTTLAQNNHEEVILIRRCSEPNQNVRKLYDALRYKYAPFVKRKSVVHKSELENCQFIEKQQFRSD